MNRAWMAPIKRVEPLEPPLVELDARGDVGDSSRMALRVRALSSLDPLAVPLPHGTEVTTRVSRALSPDRRVPQGAVGRVVASHDNELDVMIIGIGVIRYARDELVPLRAGQVRYAFRRADAWANLRPCRVLEATVGSRAWGLADERSDADMRGIFALPFSWTVGLGDPPTDLVSADGSATYWEASKAVRQALRADPNTLETLFVASVKPLDEMGEWILRDRDAFPSAAIYGSFGRYALSQLKRLSQSHRLAEHRAIVIEWLREDPAPGLDDVAARLADAIPRAGASQTDAVLLAKEYIKQLYRSLHDQGLLAGKDYASLVEFARERSAAFELPRDLRPKNAYNLVRLLATAIHWLRTGSPELETKGSLRDLLLSIKHGEMSLDETLSEADARARDLEEARRATKLPAHPDVGRADALLQRIGEEVARRHIEGRDGPFGRGAPAPPEVVWDDGAGDDEGERGE